MARPVTMLVVFFVGLNVFAGMLGAAPGVEAVLGLDTTVGEDDEINDTVDQAGEVDTGSGTGSTLFDMYHTLGTGWQKLTNALFPGLDMLNRAGVPGYITYGFLSPLFTLIIAIGVMSYVRGWGL